MNRHRAQRRSEQGARELFQPLPRRYDLLAEVLSLGQNGRWRRRMVDEVASLAPESVLDVATGTARVALEITARTGADVIGLDITEGMLLRGRDEIRERGLEARIQLIVATARRLPFRDGVFDALTFTYLLRYVPDPEATLREMARVVRPGGRMASLEFLIPRNRAWRSLWWLYTRAALPLGSALGGRRWFDVGRFLGPSISEHYRRYPLSWHLQAWRGAGMIDVKMSIMSLGTGLVLWGTKRDE